MDKKTFTWEVTREQAKGLIRGNPPERLDSLMEHFVQSEEYENAQMVKDVIDENFASEIKDKITNHISRNKQDPA